VSHYNGVRELESLKEEGETGYRNRVLPRFMLYSLLVLRAVIAGNSLTLLFFMTPRSIRFQASRFRMEGIRHKRKMNEGTKERRKGCRWGIGV
jgi:hypothetical protein